MLDILTSCVMSYDEEYAPYAAIQYIRKRSDMMIPERICRKTSDFVEAADGCDGRA